MASFCTGLEFTLRGYVYPTLFTSTAITLIYATLRFTMAFMNNQLKTSNTLFFAGLSFYVVIVVHNLCEATYFGLYCYFGDKYYIFDLITQYLYPIQGVILVTFLFLKLISIFKYTDFAISKVAVYTFSTLSIIGIICALIAQTLICFPELGPLFLVLITFFASSFIYIFLVLWINLLFLRKLYIVYKSSQDVINNNQKLIKVITKTAILCFISTIFIIAFLASYFIVRVGYSPYAYLLSRLALIGDIYTSFASIYLSYDYFDGLYLKMFGYCHNKCQVCWMNCANNDHELTMIRMRTNSSTKDVKELETNQETV